MSLSVNVFVSFGYIWSCENEHLFSKGSLPWKHRRRLSWPFLCLSLALGVQARVLCPVAGFYSGSIMWIWGVSEHTEDMWPTYEPLFCIADISADCLHVHNITNCQPHLPYFTRYEFILASSCWMLRLFSQNISYQIETGNIVLMFGS